MIERDIRLAKLTGAHYHVAHVSTRDAVNVIREAKKSGLNITYDWYLKNILKNKKKNFYMIPLSAPSLAGNEINFIKNTIKKKLDFNFWRL